MVIFKLFVAEIGGARDEVRVLLGRGWLGWWGGWSVESWSVSTYLYAVWRGCVSRCQLP
jgi:hypothetical protein